MWLCVKTNLENFKWHFYFDDKMLSRIVFHQILLIQNSCNPLRALRCFSSKNTNSRICENHFEIQIYLSIYWIYYILNVHRTHKLLCVCEFTLWIPISTFIWGRAAKIKLSMGSWFLKKLFWSFSSKSFSSFWDVRKRTYFFLLHLLKAFYCRSSTAVELLHWKVRVYVYTLH